MERETASEVLIGDWGEIFPRVLVFYPDVLAPNDILFGVRLEKVAPELLSSLCAEDLGR